MTPTMRPDPKFARRVTLARNEVDQLRREALRLEQAAAALQRGDRIEDIARNLESAADGMRYLLDRAAERGTVH